MAAEAIGRAVLAARLLNTPATPAATPTGPRATGIHIIRLPKLARSCSSQISAAVTAAPAAVRPDSVRSNLPCPELRETQHHLLPQDLPVLTVVVDEHLDR